MDFWLKQLAETNGITELPKIELSRPKDGRSFVGPGSLTRDDDGQLRLKVYAPADARAAFGLVDGPAGTLVPRQDLFELNATDMDGYSWQSEGIWPDASVSMPTGLAVLTGDISRLSGRRPPISSGKCHLKLAFRTDATFPTNQREQTERKIGENVVSAKYSRSAAEFDVDSRHVRVYRDGDLLVLQVTGQWLPDSAETLASHVSSAMQFMIGRRLLPEVITSASRNGQTQIIQSVMRVRMQPKVEPPRHWRNAADESITWEIFHSFLRYLQSVPDGTARELCRWTAEVIDTGRAPLEVSSLVLSVAVEGIVGLLQGKETVDERVLADIEQAVKVASQAGFPESLRPRIVGAIRSMKQLRARDYLERLVARGELPEEQLNAWKALRNSSAHADASEGDWVAPTVRRTSIVLAMFYRLVFMLIQYRGPYTDYSEIGWPERGVAAE